MTKYGTSTPPRSVVPTMKIWAMPGCVSLASTWVSYSNRLISTCETTPARMALTATVRRGFSWTAS